MAEKIARLRPDFDLEARDKVDASELLRSMPDIFGPGRVNLTGKIRGGLDLGARYTNSRTGLTARRMSVEGGGKVVQVRAAHPHEAAALVVLADRMGDDPLNEVRFEARPGIIQPREGGGAEIVHVPGQSDEAAEYEQYVLWCEGDAVQRFEAMRNLAGSIATTEMLGVADGRSNRALDILYGAVVQRDRVVSVQMVLTGLGELATIGPYRPH